MELDLDTRRLFEISEASYALRLDLPRVETPWTVLTGVPSCGKTTSINLIRDLGFPTSHEIARELFDQCEDAGNYTAEFVCKKLGSAIEEIIFSKVLMQTLAVDPTKPHAFDRGLCDCPAFLHALGLPWEHLKPVYSRFQYRKVLILDAMPVEQDGMRWESEEFRQKLDYSLEYVYKSCGNTVVRIPAMDGALKRFELIKKEL